MATSTTKTNKPINPRGNDQSPKGYNRAALYSGKALDFDGVNDDVNFGDVSDLDFGTGNFSFSLYVKINSAQSSLENIFSKKDAGASTAGYSIFYNHLTGKLLFSNANGTSASEIYSADSFTQYEDQWIHLVAVRDSSDDKNAYFYINAVKHELASTLTIYDTDNSYDFKIGNTHTGTYFNNQQVAGFKAFNVALTAAQVSDLYNNPEKIVPTGVSNDALKLWLPMMEGAGTTAYDGSGNGNHGTISGATYVNGVGAPVAQSAVIDWNKGVNEVPYSTELDNAYFVKGRGSIVANQTTAPDGLTTADKFEEDTQTGSHYVGKTATYSSSVGDVWTAGIWVKADERTQAGINIQQRNSGSFVSFTNAIFNLSTGAHITTTSSGTQPSNVNYAITAYANDWYLIRLNVTTTSGNQVDVLGHVCDGGSELYTGVSGYGVFFWGIHLFKGSIDAPYIPTLATAQTSPVLLPQGLTSGRDITGVNLFENVRKQGALNLDGNSWAEVHDNASLDITSAITLEAWVYAGSGTDNGVLGKWYYTTNKKSYIIYQAGINSFRFYTSSDGDNNAYAAVTTSSGWNHLVGVDDGTNLKFYVNGSEEASVASLGSIYASDQNLKIGNMVLTSQSFPNPIAQPRIYNRALTAEEVQRNYDAGKNIYTNS